MAETTALPLQQTSTPTVATAAAPTNGAARATGPVAAQPPDANGTEAPTDAARLFDLLLGDAPESGAGLDPAQPVLARTTTARRLDDAPVEADPLQLILAQMPMPATAVPAQAATSPTAAVSAEGAASSPAPVTAASPAPAGLQMPGVLQDAALDGQGAPAPTAAAQPQAVDVKASTAMPDGLMAAMRSAAPGTDFPATASVRASGQPVSPFAALAADMAPASQVGGDSPAGPAASPVQAMQGLGVVQVHATAAPQSAPAPVPVLHQPADPAQGYDEPFGQHVAWLAGQRMGQAEIRVVPEHLGVIDIRLQMDGNNVRAEFHSSQPEVRQALEASFPRLRDMLGQQGLQLSHAGVGQGQSGQRQPGGGAQGQGQAEGLTLPHEAGSPLPPDFRRGRGLVDVYA
ncbi:MAG TPA: flagellar hook-length control protein FliK [Thermomonas sp.]